MCLVLNGWNEKQRHWWYATPPAIIQARVARDCLAITQQITAKLLIQPAINQRGNNHDIRPPAPRIIAFDCGRHPIKLPPVRIRPVSETENDAPSRFQSRARKNVRAARGEESWFPVGVGNRDVPAAQMFAYVASEIYFFGLLWY